MLAAYGEEYFRNTWSAWVDAMTRLYEIGNGDICKKVLPKIKCPTLIVHGGKDVMVHPEHPTYLKEHIKNSRSNDPLLFNVTRMIKETLHYRLKIFEKGSHVLHLKYHEEFNTLARTFLLENSGV